MNSRPWFKRCRRVDSNALKFIIARDSVIMVMPDKMLVMSGAFGPLQRLGATGTLSFVLMPLHNETRLEVTYAVGGYLPDGLNTWAAPVDKVLTEQVTRLKSYVETGAADSAAAKKP